MEKVLVIGLGEVGKPLYELIKESGRFEVYGYDIDPRKIPQSQGEIPQHIDIMHICYPCSDGEEFAKITVEYMKRFLPGLTIINSTVAPGTTKLVFELSEMKVVHSPVRGVHRNMKNDLLFWTKYIGAFDQESARKAAEHFEKIGIKTKILSSPIETELAKLFETTYRALMIAWFQEMHRICRFFKANFVEVIDMLEDIHKVRFDRPIFYPGVIGGHCLIPNAMLLLKAYDSNFIKALLKSNEQRKKELNDPSVVKEILEVKDRVKELEMRISKYPYEKSIW